MAKLNERTDKTKKIIHLMVTTLCDRNCKYCCNKQYNLNDIPYVTDEELREAEVLCITGGEPFLFANPCEIAKYYKLKYKNIKKVYVYTSACGLFNYIHEIPLCFIDGINISIKTKNDASMFESFIKDNKTLLNLESNRLYVFDNLYKGKPQGFEVIHREWQEDFKPANDSIFRKV